MSKLEPGGKQVIGRYVLHDEIASGGMATVHFGRLRGEAGFSKTVAIKSLHPEYARDRDFVAMFLDEVRIAARIQHPNVVTTVDVVRIDDALCLVMEYVDGESLSRLLKSLQRDGQRMPPRVAAGIMIGVLRGLHAAHEALDEDDEPLHIIHRDVSPHNILVGRDGIARVLDFGVAKVAGQVQSTREGQVKGKLNYMAPEQVRGEKLDRRADIFSAGVVLWEALTGKRLRDGEDEGVVYAQVLDSTAAPPSGIAADLPDGVDELVLKALAKDPTERHATARELADDLEQLFGVVSPRTVSKWIEEYAKDVLAVRSQRRKEIEADSSSDIKMRSQEYLEQAPASRRRPRRHATMQPTGSSVTIPTLPAAASVPESLRAAPPKTKRILLAGALIAFVVGGGLAAVLMAGDSESQAETAATDATSVAAPTEPSASAQLAAEPPAASGQESVVPSATTSATASATTEPPAATVARKPRKPPSRAAVRPKSSPKSKPAGANCDPPYVVNAEGVRRYKVECL